MYIFPSGQPVQVDASDFSVQEIWERRQLGQRRAHQPRSDGLKVEVEQEDEGEEHSKFLDLAWTLPRGMSLREKFVLSFRDEEQGKLFKVSQKTKKGSGINFIQVVCVPQLYEYDLWCARMGSVNTARFLCQFRLGSLGQRSLLQQTDRQLLITP